MRTACICLIFILLGPAASAAAEPGTPDAGSTELDTVVFTATRTERPLKETAASVTVISEEEIQEQLVQDIRDLVRYEPGVTVSSDATRFGLGGFEIRGIGGNRVLTELDGVPVPDAFAIGSFSNAGRDFVDPEVLKRVEILRGSASALYGSDAIGGVVSFTTKDPVDYLRDDIGAYAAAKLGYNSDDNSGVATAIGAFGDADNGWLFAFTRRDGEESDNQGDVESEDANRTAPNPQEYSANNLLAKGVFARGDNVFRVTLDAHQGDTATEVLSGLVTQDFSAMFGFPYLVQTTALSGDDERRRMRLSGDWEFRGDGLFDAGNLLVYAQRSETRQETDERRTTTVFGVPSSIARHRVFEFEQDVAGANLLFRKSFGGADGPDHLLVYGLELEHTDTLQQRDGTQTDLATGAITNVVTPDEFPVRDFPPSTTLEAGLYVQDEIRWSRFTLIPGVRLDYYRLEPDSDDPVFVADNPGIVPVDIDATHVSPKLGMLYDFNAAWTGFFQYASGFRAPPYNDVNVGFTNLAFGYTAIPNPDLEPETSDHFELGMRRDGERSALSLSVFHNRYDDFIESFVSLGVDPVTGLLVFQSQNFSEVTTEGVELKAHYDLESVAGLRLIASLAYARGENEQTDEPLNSIAPHAAVLGADYVAPDGRWGMELVGTFVAGKSDVDESDGKLFMPGGYGTFDVLGWYAFTPDVKLHAGVFNVTDRKYWQWSGVRGRPADDPVIDRYTAPGVNASIALRVAF